MTLKQTIERIQSISLAHDQLKSFYFGMPTDFLTDRKTELPAILVQDLPGTIDWSRKETVYPLKIYLVGYVEATSEIKATDELQVQSDMTLVGHYIIAEMNSNSYTDWAVQTTSSFTLLREEFDDLVAGVVIDTQIRTPYTSDICEPLTY